jgi:hypothetical protein
VNQAGFLLVTPSKCFGSCGDRFMTFRCFSLSNTHVLKNSGNRVELLDAFKLKERGQAGTAAVIHVHPGPRGNSLRVYAPIGYFERLHQRNDWIWVVGNGAR